ncbi:MAG: nucleotidyltransferase domain-containing protein [Candidatus Fibromonas sp.]|jgi:predicted nucleotidyltransferase|nr:nucleotidyltransferase domain-containing protein [Candidatus Fibromonas sp.]
MSLSPDIISRIIQCLTGFNLYKVVLFGSYARGTANEDSDVDLLVILDTDKFAKTFKEKIERRTPISMALLDINRLFAMDIIVYSKGEFDYLKDKGDFFVKEIEDTGLEIYGK